MRWKRGSKHPARERVHLLRVFAGSRPALKPNRIHKVPHMMQLIVYVTSQRSPDHHAAILSRSNSCPITMFRPSYWHRIAVILGFAMLILLNVHAEYRPGASEVGHQSRAASGGLGGIRDAECSWSCSFSPLVVGFSWLIATVPNEWI